MKPKLTILASKEIEDEVANYMTGNRIANRGWVNNNAHGAYMINESRGKYPNPYWHGGIVRGNLPAIYTGGPLVANVDTGRPILSAPITTVVPLNWEEDAKCRIIFETAFPI